MIPQYQKDCAVILYRVQRRNADVKKHHQDVLIELQKMFEGFLEVACGLVDLDTR